MSAPPYTLTVKLGAREFIATCPEERKDQLHEAAALVQQKYVQATEKAKGVSPDRLLFLMALDMAALALSAPTDNGDDASTTLAASEITALDEAALVVLTSRIESALAAN